MNIVEQLRASNKLYKDVEEIKAQEKFDMESTIQQIEYEPLREKLLEHYRKNK